MENKIEFKKVKVTPKLAAEFLSKNTLNRPVRKSKVIQYSEDMLNDRWMSDTGEAVAISENGNITNGQHRFLSIIKSNRTIDLWVCYNVKEDTKKVVDTGSNRSGGDVFHIEGIKNANNLAAMMKSYNRIKSGLVSDSSHLLLALTNYELLNLYKSNPLFWDDAHKKTLHWYKSIGRLLKASSIGAYYAHFYSINQNDAYDFMEQLCTGIDLKNNVIGLLRTRLIKDATGVKKTPANVITALVIKSWNAYRKGVTVKNLWYNSASETFPIAI